MAEAARTLSPEVETHEAVEILRRMEPLLGKMDDRIRVQGEAIARLDGRMNGLEGRMSGLEGRLSQIPTIWTLATMIISIFGFAFVLLRFAAPH